MIRDCERELESVPEQCTIHGVLPSKADVPGLSDHGSPLKRLREMVDFASTTPMVTLLARTCNHPIGEIGLHRSIVHLVDGPCRHQTTDNEGRALSSMPPGRQTHRQLKKTWRPMVEPALKKPTSPVQWLIAKSDPISIIHHSSNNEVTA